MYGSASAGRWRAVPSAAIVQSSPTNGSGAVSKSGEWMNETAPVRRLYLTTVYSKPAGR